MHRVLGGGIVCACLMAIPASGQSLGIGFLQKAAPVARQEPVQRLEVGLVITDIRLDLRGGRYPRHASGRPPERQVARGASIAVHWARRFTSEIDVISIGTRSDVYDEEIVAMPTDSLHVFLSHEYRALRIAPSQLVRFGVGSRVQPFLGVAVGIDRVSVHDKRTEYREAPLTEAQRLSLSNGPTPPQANDIFPTVLPASSTERRVHAFGRAGVKLFPSRHFFLVMEGQVGTRVQGGRFGLGIALP